MISSPNVRRMKGVSRQTYSEFQQWNVHHSRGQYRIRSGSEGGISTRLQNGEKSGKWDFSPNFWTWEQQKSINLKYFRVLPPQNWKFWTIFGYISIEKLINFKNFRSSSPFPNGTLNPLLLADSPTYYLQIIWLEESKNLYCSLVIINANLSFSFERSGVTECFC